MLQYVPGTKQY